MSERFTDRARRVLRLANDESRRLNHHYIGTEHILLGIVSEGSSFAANVLMNLGIDLGRVRTAVERIVLVGPDATGSTPLPQSPRAKKVIEFAIEEARNLNHDYVGTEHLLLGLLREQEGVAAQVLMDLGVRLAEVREEVLCLLGPRTLPAKKHKPTEVMLEDFPVDVQRNLTELNAQIERLNFEKEEAVAEQRFDQAAHLRDQVDRLKKRRSVLLADWPAKHPIDPSWLSWNGGTVDRIAQEIRESSRWGDLPVLADALEEAGCSDLEILSHCRQVGNHANRCWVVELLLRRM
jgi:ATP-dependent Clp protease ATP-binding subunit ClpA